MPNAFQQQRNVNINRIKKMIAQSMPNGIANTKLNALFNLEFAPPKTREYLKTLEDAGVIEYDREEDKWRMVG